MQALSHLDLSGKVALVTGASRGIGLATARMLTERGARVVGHHFQSAPPAGCAWTLQQDLALAGAGAALTTQALALAGRLDYLVNNAAFTPRVGVRPEVDPITFQSASAESGFDPALFDRAMAINVRVPMELALAAKWEAIVNVGANNTRSGDGSSAYFVASKGAIPAVTQYLARRLAPETRVNAVLAGLIATEEIAARGPEFEPLRQQVIRKTPMGRLGLPEEVAETIVYLLAGNTFITGECLDVDGGWRL